MQNEMRKLIEAIEDASTAFSTYEDMSGDAGFINFPEGLDAARIYQDAEDLLGFGGAYPDATMRETTKKEGPVVPKKLIIALGRAVDLENEERIEDFHGIIQEYWFGAEGDSQGDILPSKKFRSAEEQAQDHGIDVGTRVSALAYLRDGFRWLNGTVKFLMVGGFIFQPDDEEVELLRPAINYQTDKFKKIET